LLSVPPATPPAAAPVLLLRVLVRTWLGGGSTAGQEIQHGLDLELPRAPFGPQKPAVILRASGAALNMGA